MQMLIADIVEKKKKKCDQKNKQRQEQNYKEINI